MLDGKAGEKKEEALIEDLGKTRMRAQDTGLSRAAALLGHPSIRSSFPLPSSCVIRLFGVIVLVY